MRKKVFAVLLIVGLLVGMLSAAIPVSAGPPAPDYEIMDIGPELRAWEPTLDRIVGPTPMDMLSGEESGEGGSASASAVVGEVKLWFGLDSYCGYYYFKPYELRAVGTYAEVWVALDLSWTIPPGEWICQDKPSDPRPAPVITNEQVQYILAEFDNNIYPTDTGFFGMPDYHDGAYSLLVAWGLVPPGYYDGDKVTIMIDNVRDENWYDHNYPLYIGGFFSPSYEAYFDRNMITIDAYDWLHRTGPNPPDDPPTYPARPFAYEGVTAHELEHLIHSDMDPNEVSWVDEGCADFAEFICDYAPALRSHIRDTAAYPENSLVIWGDQGGLELLSDYGHAYLWTLYISEIFGQSFIQDLVANPDDGIAGVNSTLVATGYPGVTFEQLYHDYAAALLIDSEDVPGGRYWLDNIDFNLDIGKHNKPNPEAYDKPGAPPWGTDYVWITGPRASFATFYFNGIGYALYGIPWSSDGDVLWSGTGHLVDNWLIASVDLSGYSSASLAFDTYYDIEDDWDFGFVQVSTDGGQTWVSLANAYTTDVHHPSAHPKIVQNLPGLTGWSGVWVNMSFDLTPYAGQDILIAFRYMTDWATEYEGWYIDNIEVTADADTPFTSDGSSLDDFEDITEILRVNNAFEVTFVGFQGHGQYRAYRVADLPLDPSDQEGMQLVRDVFEHSSKVAMLVTFKAPQFFETYADYDYYFEMIVPRGH